ncbi:MULTISPECIES: translation elongation factor Ts [Stappiaceae]|uniref:Elongation factor Ts n=2 Tax=Roseibium TaxID=150830 RepID=A0A0M6XYV1_9HYPH|nr:MULTISPECIES: translation elongation factor Ts [Stappiaceae]MCR9282919.1 translation elongation factor Ts [Paracoccaceae bacterium]MEC9405336.1 translation elongation factor Ts [Pseudomonadota bacterium]AQQ06544.1 translation elongation factor Ts [Roseibium aggregatum]MBN8182793.1 elongation factor Ts [Roseibium aggregatum]MBO6856980.1 elongation factor Ts [Roseibium sp.]
MSITAAMVKELREKSGAGMMDCKTALTEAGGDMEAAVDWLRTKGLAKAAKKAGRVAAEGLVGVAADGNKAAVIELNSETDFVARNEGFQELVSNVAKVAVGTDGSVEAVSAANLGGKPVAEAITDAIATIGENMTLRRTAVLAVNEGVVATYVHSAVSDGLGKIGVLVALESAGDKDKLNGLGRQIAMHVAATSPLSLNTEELDPTVVEREKSVFSEQARESGKPENIIEKMVEGRLRKFYEEVTLVKQAFVINPDQTVEQAVEALAKEIGAEVKLTGFVRFAIGEGIEKEEQDFAAEVAAATGQ